MICSTFSTFLDLHTISKCRTIDLTQIICVFKVYIIDLLPNFQYVYFDLGQICFKSIFSYLIICIWFSIPNWFWTKRRFLNVEISKFVNYCEKIFMLPKIIQFFFFFTNHIIKLYMTSAELHRGGEGLWHLKIRN